MPRNDAARDALHATLSLTQLAYAVAVDTHRHFGRAAASCHVTQPTLSMQLGKLERDLGVTLFDRSRTPVVPTDMGRLIIEQAREVLRSATRILELRDQAQGVVAGELRLGVIPTLAPYLLPRLLGDLGRRHPHLELVVEELVTADIAAGLRRETLDVGLVATSLAYPGFSERALFAEPFVAYVSRNHRLATRSAIAPGDLSAEDVWLLGEEHCFRAQAIAACAERSRGRGRAGAASRRPDDAPGRTRRARFESGNLETLKRLVERGDGMTLLPALAAEDLASERQRALVRPFTVPAPTREIRLVRRRAYLKRHLVDALVESLLAALPAGLRPASGPRRRSARQGGGARGAAGAQEVGELLG